MYRPKALVAWLVVSVLVLAGCTVLAGNLPQVLDAQIRSVTQGTAPAVVQAAQQTSSTQPSAVQVAQQAASTQQPPAATLPTPVPTTASNITINVQPGADPENQIFEAVYQKVNPSVVQISTLGRSRRLSQDVPQGEGSGFVWDSQGDIVTNDHVVEGADKLQVTFADGATLDAQLVGTDPNGDIAVIKVNRQLVTLVPVEVGDVQQLKVGERVIAIGNPFGFAGTMTQGIVSALGRSIPGVTGFSIPEAIQTDAAINPGNSGGPLLNERGQVVGVNDQIQTQSGGSSGVGFAIPIDIVQRIVPALIQAGHYAHPYLGIEGENYTLAWAQALGFPANAKGAYVQSLVTGSPAERAGLRAGSQDTTILLGIGSFRSPIYLQSGGDLITAIDGHLITKMDDLMMYLEENTSPGQTVQLTVLRAGGHQQTISVVLGQRPDQAPSQTS